MRLSSEEEELLAGITEQLRREDPQFAQVVGRLNHRRAVPRHMLLPVGGVLLGLLALPVALETGILALGWAGFALSCFALEATFRLVPSVRARGREGQSVVGLKHPLRPAVLTGAVTLVLLLALINLPSGGNGSSAAPTGGATTMSSSATVSGAGCASVNQPCRQASPNAPTSSPYTRAVPDPPGYGYGAP